MRARLLVVVGAVLLSAILAYLAFSSLPPAMSRRMLNGGVMSSLASSGELDRGVQTDPTWPRARRAWCPRWLQHLLKF